MRSFSQMSSCTRSATPPRARIENEVSLPDVQAHVSFAVGFAGPNFIMRAKFIPWALRHLFGGSAQGVIAASRTGLTGRLGRSLRRRLKRGNAGLQFFNAFWRLGQSFPDGRFIKDLRNVRY